MSTPEERLSTIQANYDQASENEPHDLARAKSPADVAKIQANVATARAIYYSAIAAMLTENSSIVESAYQDAITAQQRVATARSKAEEIPSLLQKLADYTGKAGVLLKQAQPALAAAGLS